MVKLARVFNEINSQLDVEQDPEKRMTLRVASRWVRSSVQADYDMFLRLQVLEGAAGKLVDQWWKKGRAAMPMVKATFENKPVDPAWFAVGSTDMFKIVSASCYRVLHQYKVPLEPLDFINSSLMGVPIDPTDKEILRSPHEVGKRSAARIQNGIDTPITLAKGPLSTFITRKIINMAKHFKESPLPMDDEGNIKDIEDTSERSIKNVGDLLYMLLFREDISTPLGEKLRALTRRLWGNPARAYSRTMLPWFEDAVEGDDKPKKFYAEAAGVAWSTFSQRHWDYAWRDFLKALKGSSSLINQLEEVALLNDIQWNRSSPIPFSGNDPIGDVKVKRPRGASHQMLIQNWSSFPSDRTRFLLTDDITLL